MRYEITYFNTDGEVHHADLLNSNLTLQEEAEQVQRVILNPNNAFEWSGPVMLTEVTSDLRIEYGASVLLIDHASGVELDDMPYRRYLLRGMLKHWLCLIAPEPQAPDYEEDEPISTVRKLPSSYPDELQGAYVNNSNKEIQRVVDEMVQIDLSSTASADEKRMAHNAIIDALFPREEEKKA